MGADAMDAVVGASLNDLRGNAFYLPSLETISADLNNKNVSIVVKMSHLFSLRELGGPEATQQLLEVLKDRMTVDSVLFRHEAVYLLGQLGNPEAVSFLEDLLADTTESEVVRHEAAEALAAIGSERSLKTLSAYLKDPSVPVKQTCEVAIDSLRHKCEQEASGQQTDRKSCFNTVDPSQAFEGCTPADVPHLFNLLMDPNEPLWTRYRALTTLRDLRIPAAASAVARALRQDKTSALLRHEIAFVLGQIQFPPSGGIGSATANSDVAIYQAEMVNGANCPFANTSAAAASEAAQALVDCLKNPNEHSMARHEAALALGSLGADADSATCDCGGKSVRDVAVNALQTHRESTDQMVSESCIVALSNMQDALNTSFGV